MTARVKRHEYGSREELAEALASGVAAILAGGTSTNSRALLAVSGGSTPDLLFERLSREPIDWASVTVLPVDERLVHPEHPRANARLIRERLLVNAAQPARFAQMGERDGRIAIERDEASLAVSGSDGIDALVLGMGTDGHTASFFADGDSYDAVTDPRCPVPVMPLRTPSQAEARMTLTMPAILSARFLALHIEGEAKREVFESAVEGADLPISRVLAEADEIALFWTP